MSRIRRWSALCLLLVATPLAAQVSGNAGITATADVSTTALVAVVNQNLDFGFPFPGGGPVVVSPQAGTQRAEVEIHGARRAEINVSLVLPPNLVSGANTLPILFGAGSGCHRDRLPGPACTLFDPAVGFTNRIRNQNFPNNAYYVWLGGTIIPPIAQPPGTYTATITLTTAYTGN